MFAKLASEFCFDLLEVEGLKAGTRAAVDPGLVPDNVGAQWLGEASNGLTEVSLEELDDRRWEVQLISTLQDILLGETVRRHPLGEITNDLGGWCDLSLVSATNSPVKLVLCQFTLMIFPHYELSYHISQCRDFRNCRSHTNSLASMYFFLISARQDHSVKDFHKKAVSVN